MLLSYCIALLCLVSKNVVVGTPDNLQFGALPNISNYVINPEDLNYLSEVINPQKLFHFLVNEQNVSSDRCSQDLKKLGKDITSFSLYAWQMLDSWAKLPDGLLLGNHYFIGQYDECIEAVSTGDEETKFRGQYCSIKWIVTINIPGVTLKPTNVIYTIGICIPSSCRAGQINRNIQNLATKYNFTLNLLATDEGCSETAPQMRPGDWVVVAFLSILGLLIVLSTAYETWLTFTEKKPHPLFVIFSLKKNATLLFSVQQGNEQMSCLHGLRFISICWVLLCHSSMLYLYGPVSDPLNAFKAILDTNKLMISNGYLSVDSFFVLSGLLVSFVFFRDIGKTGSYDAPRGYINRYLRLTPPYAMMILLQVTILHFIGDGPLWHQFDEFMTKDCNTYWWSGLIYVQNFVNPKKMCLIQTWYLSADMQFYWIAPLLLYPVYLWPMLGFSFLVLLTIASSFWSFAINYVNKFPPTAILDTTGKNNELDNYASYNRLPPWLVGLILGIIICHLKSRKIEPKLKKWQVALGWSLASVFCLASFFGLLSFFKGQEYASFTYDPAASAAFTSFHRLGWAVGLAWIIFACIYGYGGIVNTLMSWEFFQPLAKMSYGVYLVHVSVMVYKLSYSRTLSPVNLTDMILVWFSLLLASNLFGIFLALCVEYPFLNIDRYFFRDIKIFPYPPPGRRRRRRENGVAKAEAPVEAAQVETSQEAGKNYTPVEIPPLYHPEKQHLSTVEPETENREIQPS